MTMSIKSTTAALVLFVLTSGMANASLSQGEIDQEVLSSFSGNGNVTVTVKNNVATVSGWVEDALSQSQVLAAVTHLSGVDSVKGFVTISN